MEPILLKRGQIAEKRDQANYVDVTVKSSKGIAALFAPSWAMVTGHKSGTVSDQEYIDRYHTILRQLPFQTWKWLAEQEVDGEVTVLCYCPVAKPFCHTALLIEYATTHFPDKFFKADLD